MIRRSHVLHENLNPGCKYPVPSFVTNTEKTKGNHVIMSSMETQGYRKRQTWKRFSGQSDNMNDVKLVTHRHDALASSADIQPHGETTPQNLLTQKGHKPSLWPLSMFLRVPVLH